MLTINSFQTVKQNYKLKRMIYKIQNSMNTETDSSKYMILIGNKKPHISIFSKNQMTKCNVNVYQSLYKQIITKMFLIQNRV